LSARKRAASGGIGIRVVGQKLRRDRQIGIHAADTFQVLAVDVRDDPSDVLLRGFAQIFDVIVRHTER